MITKLRPWHQPPNCAVITLRQIIEGDAPILLVTHDMDDHGWQFLSRAGHQSQELCSCRSLRDCRTRPFDSFELSRYATRMRVHWRRSVSDPWMREIMHEICQTDPLRKCLLTAQRVGLSLQVWAALGRQPEPRPFAQGGVIPAPALWLVP